MTNLKTIGMVLLLFLAFLIPVHAEAETLGSIAVSLSYSNGDIADYYPVSLTIYQDSSTVPYREVSSLSGNPFNIVSLPTGHQYKIASQVNGLHASDSYVNLEQSHQEVNMKLPLPGGMRVDVYYNDGVTPIPNAAVNVVSLDNKTWAQGSTNINGQTMRFWLEPTVYQFDHYVVNVKIGSHLTYSQSPVFLTAGAPQEIKAVTNWPTAVDSAISVKVLGEDQKPVFSNGNLTIFAVDSNGNKIVPSSVSSKAEALFSSLKVGDYQFKAVAAGDAAVLGNLNATINGTQTSFTIHETPQISIKGETPPTHHEVASCNCVAFRVDNIQDYWLDNVQLAVMDAFYQNNAKQTIGIIANAFGSDSKLVNHIKQESGNIDAAINGWNFEDFSMISQQQQSHLLTQAQQKITAVFKTSPSVFIPPYGRADDDTFFAMSNNSITTLSATPNVVPPASLDEQFHLFPTNVILDTSQNSTNDQILSEIKSANSNYGFAVVTVSFQNYAQNNGTNAINAPDQTKIGKLVDLIDAIQNGGIKIVTIKEMSDDLQSSAKIPSWIKNNAKWWSSGTVSDDEFVSAMQYLIQQGVLQIPHVQSSPASSHTIPAWVKNNAGWWASGELSDSEFVSGMQYLIASGMIQIS